ncbi:MAG: competence/damage-inducible protein A [Chthoniobacterales bacterium]|nr:competence/damage-inducible protein A [Chthoniobacterales bacterium]
MQAEVINTGSELLLGLVTNTHLGYLAGELEPYGITIARQVCVPDGPPIRDALDSALDRADLVFATGGLGPTTDDITREAAAELLGLPLLPDEHILSGIRERFARRGLPMADRVARQAMVPVGAEILPNPHGTAPGLYFSPSVLGGRKARHLLLLPGPPRELRPMVNDHVLPKLRSVLPPSSLRERRIYRLTGIGESQVEERIGKELEERGDLEVGYCARPSEVDFRLIGPPDIIASVDSRVRTAMGEWIYSDGEPLENAVVGLLRERKLTLALAESCTGGTLAGRITNVPGASEVFLAGYVTYSNKEKQRALGVPHDLIEAHGAVSEPVAVAMAEGARRISGADAALSTTGIAGPGGGSETKPVGTVFVALAAKGHETVVRRCYFPLDRATFKHMATSAALDLLRRHVLALPLNLGGGSSSPRLG